ncbi:MAG: ABC transporter substrate-binding protein [Propionibacteriaceae bacterium]|nr:ABC transporter substrate-binding protein [Propionibacteriaceae bacterium]
MMVQRHRRVAALACAAALALSLAACAGDTGDGPESTGGGVGAAVVAGSSVSVFTGQVGDFTAPNFNPFNTTGSYLQPTQGAIYEALFYYNIARADDPRPVLGESFSWNDDGTVLTVQVRQGVKFSDGSDMTADDVVFSLDLVSKTAALNTSGQTWQTAKQDDQTVTLTFPKPAFTLEALLLGREPIVPKALWQDVGDPTAGTNEQPVGTGPYMFDQYQPQAIILKANPYYWGQGDEAPAVEYVRYISLANADAATTALQQGTVDWQGSFLPTLKQLIADSDGTLAYSNTPQATTGLFACANADLGCVGPQTDKAVRQAMYYAMDRAQLNTQAAAGFALPASPTLLPNFVNQDEITSPDYLEVPQTADVAKAKSILEAAGWAMADDGYYAKDGQTLEMTLSDVSGWTDYNTMCELLAGQFKQAGIKLVVSHVAQNAWSQAEVSGQFQLSMNSVNMGASSNPYYTYNNYVNGVGTRPVGEAAVTTNTMRYSNPAVDAAVAALAATNDPDESSAQYKIIQDALVEDMPIIPIYVNSALCEYNLTHATGWPSQDDLYAFPLPWGGNWGTGIVLKTIRPVV